MVTREQQYQYEQYMRRQQLLRNYARIVSVSGEKTEEEKKRNPDTQEDVRNGLSDITVTTMNISENMEISGNAFTITNGSEKTINIGDKTITTNGMTEDSVFIVERGSKLTLNAQNSGGISSDTTCAIKVTKAGDDESGTLTAQIEINGGTYKGKNYAVSGNGKRQNTDVTINSGEFYGMTENDSLAVFQPQNGTLTINGGLFDASTTIWIKSGTTVINNGRFLAEGDSNPYVYRGSGFNSTGDCLVVDNCGYPGSVPQISVLGGYFYSVNGKPIASYSYGSYDAISGFVYGGTFNKELDLSVIAEGYEQNYNGENWEVSKID